MLGEWTWPDYRRPWSVQLVTGHASDVAWRVGGCDLDLREVGANTAMLAAPFPTCRLAAGASLPTISDVLMDPVHDGDVLVPSLARFELRPQGLLVAFELRVSPAGEPLDSGLGETVGFEPDGSTFARRSR